MPDTTEYGFEVGRVARSIVTGKGFSSPLLPLETGPTAYLCPVYPYLVAGIFKLFGIYSVHSHIVLQIINCAFAALIVFVLHAVARRSFGTQVAVSAAWLWVFLPNAWHIPIFYIWDSTLSALWLTILFWATVAIRGEERLSMWALYGVIWASGAMINATFLSLFFPMLAWLSWDMHRRHVSWLRYGAFALILCILGVVPWTYRNYKTFGSFIPVRSNFGIMLWGGNNAVALDVDAFPYQAVWSLPEAEIYKQMGEIPYMKYKEREALTFMRSHPGLAARHIFRNIATNWFEVSDRPHAEVSGFPFSLKVLLTINALFVSFAWAGALLALRAHNQLAVPYLLLLVFYPLVYYLTSTLVRYRFPIEPIIAILSSYGFITIFFPNPKWPQFKSTGCVVS